MHGKQDGDPNNFSAKNTVPLAMDTLETTISTPHLDSDTIGMVHDATDVWVNVNGDSLKLAGFGYPKYAYAKAYPPSQANIPSTTPPSGLTPFPVAITTGEYTVEVQYECSETEESTFALVVWLKYDDNNGNTHYTYHAMAVDVPCCSEINEM
jgi:hypothetical protein